MSGGPWRVSDREVPIAITGYFMPTHAPHMPVLLGMPGTDDLFIVVFSTKNKLVSAMIAFDIAYECVAIVTNGRELLDEIETKNRTRGASVPGSTGRGSLQDRRGSRALHRAAVRGSVLMKCDGRRR